MADNNLTLSNPGQINKTGDIDAMFLKVFSGEVMTAFEETNVMKELHRMRTIDHGKSAPPPTSPPSPPARRTPTLAISPTPWRWPFRRKPLAP